MKKRLYILSGIIVAIIFAIGIYFFVFNNQLISMRSLEGQWELARVLVDGKQAPSIDQESDIDIVYYWNEQSVSFQPGSIHGFDGCNNYQGDLKLGPGGNLDISRIESSLENCPEEYIKISDHSRVLVTKYDSSKFIKDLIFVDHVEIRNNNLVLIDDGPPIKELFFDRAD